MKSSIGLKAKYLRVKKTVLQEILQSFRFFFINEFLNISQNFKVQSIDIHTSYSLNGLQPETEYMVCVRAYNKWGWSNLSKTYMFKTSVAIAEVTQTENIKQNVSGDTRDTLKYNGPDPLLLQPSVSRACDKFSVYQKYLIFIPCDSFFLLFLSTMFLL